MTMHDQPTNIGGQVVPWCPDGDTHDNVIARRNVIAALWAGQMMGLSGAAMTSYATEVHFADHQVSGDADVVEKIARDLSEKGLPVPESVVREKLWLAYREALAQLGATD